jgi:hypothetical protein
MDLVISYKLNIWTSQVLILRYSLEIFKTFSLKKHGENIALQRYEIKDYPKLYNFLKIYSTKPEKSKTNYCRV